MYASAAVQLEGMPFCGTLTRRGRNISGREEASTHTPTNTRMRRITELGWPRSALAHTYICTGPVLDVRVGPDVYGSFEEINRGKLRRDQNLRLNFCQRLWSSQLITVADMSPGVALEVARTAPCRSSRIAGAGWRHHVFADVARRSTLPMSPCRAMLPTATPVEDPDFTPSSRSSR